MQSIEHWTGCCTRLYAERACCIACTSHAERFCGAMAEWCLKRIYGMSIACQAPTIFSLGTVLIWESSRIASQCQCRQERPSLRSKGTAKFLVQAPPPPHPHPLAVYICNGGRRKIDRKGTSAGRLSWKVRFAQSPDSSASFGK